MSVVVGDTVAVLVHVQGIADLRGAGVDAIVQVVAVEAGPAEAFRGDTRQLHSLSRPKAIPVVVRSPGEECRLVEIRVGPSISPSQSSSRAYSGSQTSTAPGCTPGCVSSQSSPPRRADT